MAARPTTFARQLDALEALHGRPKRPIPRTPLEWILWENVAYLVDDERREAAFRALESKVGLTADRIAKAPGKVLLGVAQLGGMHPARRVGKLERIAALALAEGDRDLTCVLDLPVAQARRILKNFPGIGDPGAEKILLFCGASRALALDSNGLRVLVRPGHGEEKRSYSATYRSVLDATLPELGTDPARLARAHLLLRTHGQVLCRRSAPDCDACPPASSCRFARAG